jgi:hypothetical protein
MIKASNQLLSNVKEVIKLMGQSTYLREIGLDLSLITVESEKEIFDHFYFYLRGYTSKENIEVSLENFIKLNAFNILDYYFSIFDIGDMEGKTCLKDLGDNLNINETLYFVELFCKDKEFKEKAVKLFNNNGLFNDYIKKFKLMIKDLELPDYNKTDFLVYLCSQNDLFNNGHYMLTEAESKYFYNKLKKEINLSVFQYILILELFVEYPLSQILKPESVIERISENYKKTLN